MFGVNMKIGRTIFILQCSALMIISDFNAIEGCLMLTVTGSSHQSSRHGDYIRRDDLTCGNRASYQQTNEANVIFYIEDSNKWVIGPRNCVKDGGVQVKDSSLFPNDVDSPWIEYNGKTWSANANITVQCHEVQPIRLSGGLGPWEGRVEVFHENHWGTVCDDGWDINDAHVVCHMLGYVNALAATSRAQFGEGRGRIWLDEVNCTGEEGSIHECGHNGWGEETCGHIEDAGVHCGSVRLVGSANLNEGRVEVYYNRTWGTVCSDSWDMKDATVVCNMLGYNGAVEVKTNAHFGSGSGRIWLDDIECIGNESSIEHCAHRKWGTSNCHHNEDAGVICNIDDCMHTLCANGATCADGIDEYTCLCPPGFTGLHCETEINECESVPCLNYGFCEDKLDEYTCVCEPGFTGVNCETNIDDCVGANCQNSAECVDGIEEYTCKCAEGFTGVHCETELGNCDSAPCLNNATCIELLDGHQCACSPGYSGLHCQIEYKTITTQQPPLPVHKANVYNTAIIAGAIVFVIMLSFLVIFIIWCRRKRSVIVKLKSVEEIDLCDNDLYQRPFQDGDSLVGEREGVKRSNSVLDKLEIDLRLRIESCLLDSKRLTVGTQAGSGQFGHVYCGTLMSEQEPIEIIKVAIKTIKDNENDSAKIAEFLEEGTIMLDFDHENVLGLYGVIIVHHKPHVILPFMDKGDLQKHISKRGNTFNLFQLIDYTYQISKGMAYLANKKFVHRDLAARNCMINSDNVVKVADFGLARDIYQKSYYKIKDRNRPLPIKWMALESIEMLTFTVQSDVWSFGVVMWEIMSRGLKPYPDVHCYGDMRKHLRDSNRLEKPYLCPDSIYNIMHKCWHPHPHERPTFNQLKVEIGQILSKKDEHFGTSNESPHSIHRYSTIDRDRNSAEPLLCSEDTESFQASVPHPLDHYLDNVEMGASYSSSSGDSDKPLVTDDMYDEAKHGLHLPPLLQRQTSRSADAIDIHSISSRLGLEKINSSSAPAIVKLPFAKKIAQNQYLPLEAASLLENEHSNGGMNTNVCAPDVENKCKKDMPYYNTETRYGNGYLKPI